MIKFYTPKEWNSLFDCPELIIDDEGKIWSADNYYRSMFGEPAGRVDFEKGEVYGKDLGYGFFCDPPIAYLETVNGVTRVLDGKLGHFSSPILYIRDDKVYTPEQWTSMFSSPGGYVKRDIPSGGGSSGGASGRTSRGGGSSSSSSSSSSGGGGVVEGVLGIAVLVLLFIILFNLTTVSLVLAVLYALWAVITLIRHGAVFTGKNLVKGIAVGFATLVGVYLILFIVTGFCYGPMQAVNDEVAGRNELVGWIAGFGSLVSCFEKGKKS